MKITGRPPVGFYFLVHLEGDPGAETGFMEAKGFSMETELEPVSQGGENRFSYKLPKTIKYSSNLELRRGLIPDSSVFGKWCKDHFSNGLTSQNKVQPKTVTVQLMSAELEYESGGKGPPKETWALKPLISWAFVNAYPLKWDISPFSAQKSEIVVESITLAYTYFYQVNQ